MISVKYNKLFLCLASLLVMIFVFSCRNNTDKKSIVLRDTLLKGNFAAATGITFDSVAIDTFLKHRPALAEFAQDFKKLYQNSDYNFVWFDKNGLIEPATAMIAHVDDALQNHLLDSAAYLAETKLTLENLQNNTKKITPNLETELLLTAQYFIYAKNMWEGITTKDTKATEWYIPRKKLSFASLLQKSIKEKEFEDTAMVVKPYMELKDALLKFVAWRNKTGEDLTITYRDSLAKIKPGDSLTVIGELRKRLYQFADLKEDNGSLVFDSLLQQSLKAYKERMGLPINSLINKSLISSLNVSTPKRIEQILVNLERMRWMPVGQHPKEYIVVNIPEYRLHYFVNDTIKWECNVVVGKTMNKTVVFRGVMKYVVFSPYWYVPESIIAKEIKPGMAQDPDYLAKHRMEWNNGQVRQKPGPGNSLGLVKFIFPNNNSIYLHDTPSKMLFKEEDRAFSHGCVRVAAPVELALKVLSDNKGWTEERILKAMNAGKENTVVLKKQIPVNIAYFTAFVDRYGVLNFRNDIYSRDNRLAEMLISKK